MPAWSAIVVALVIGHLIYRRKAGLLWPSLGGLAVLYVFVYLGDSMPVVMPESVAGLQPGAAWIIILFAYAGIASTLPVWMLLQPRDYINGLQLFIGLGVVYLAVLFLNPTVVAPAFNTDVPAGTPPLIPLLFVTIACGAVSGFHGLVSSGTTSKQLNRETDVRFVGYFGAIGEGALALAAIIACTAGFATLADWQAVYADFGSGGLTAFVTGGATIVSNGLGLPIEFASTLLAVMAVLFAGTTMDTGVRLQRYIIQEWGNIYNVPALTNNTFATLLAVGACVALAFGAGGAAGSGGLAIWPLFGTTNQLLAGLTLLVISVMLVKLGRPAVFTLLPMVFLLLMTIAALLYQLWGFYDQGNWLLVVMDLVILVAAIWVALEAMAAFQKARRGVPTGQAAE